MTWIKINQLSFSICNFRQFFSSTLAPAFIIHAEWVFRSIWVAFNEEMPKKNVLPDLHFSPFTFFLFLRWMRLCDKVQQYINSIKWTKLLRTTFSTISNIDSQTMPTISIKERLLGSSLPNAHGTIYGIWYVQHSVNFESRQ